VKTENKSFYKSRDLPLAAALDVAGLELVGVEPSGEGCSLFFVFRNQDRCSKIAAQFWNGQLKVPARHYADSIRRLKAIIFSR